VVLIGKTFSGPGPRNPHHWRAKIRTTAIHPIQLFLATGPRLSQPVQPAAEATNLLTYHLPTITLLHCTDFWFCLIDTAPLHHRLLSLSSFNPASTASLPPSPSGRSSLLIHRLCNVRSNSVNGSGPANPRPRRPFLWSLGAVNTLGVREQDCRLHHCWCRHCCYGCRCDLLPQ
jgi:hypothetical protein